MTQSEIIDPEASEKVVSFPSQVKNGLRNLLEPQGLLQFKEMAAHIFYILWLFSKRADGIPAFFTVKA